MPGIKTIEPMKAGIYEAATLLGKELKRYLPESGIPVSSMKFFGADAGVGKIAEYETEPLIVQNLDGDFIDFLDILFLCDRNEVLDAIVARANSGKGPIVIDLVGFNQAEQADGCYVTNVLEPEKSQKIRHFSSPDAASILLSSTLKPLAGAFKMKKIDAVVFNSVSDYGESGIDELHQQTLGLLNMKTVPVSILKRRVAFDVFPLSGKERQNLSNNVRIEKELRRLLPLSDWSFELTGFLLPVFHGLGILLTIEGKSIPPLKKLEGLLKEMPNVRVIPSSEPASPGNIEDNEGIFVTVLPTNKPRNIVKFWIAGDNLRRGCIFNTLEILKGYLSAVESPPV